MGEVLERVRKFATHIWIGLDEVALTKEHRERDGDFVKVAEHLQECFRVCSTEL